MSTQPKVTASSLRAKKQKGQKISMLTAYDAPMASFIDQAGVDLVLVSDAVGTVGNGRSEAVSVTVEEMIYHTRAVRNGVKRCHGRDHPAVRFLQHPRRCRAHRHAPDEGRRRGRRPSRRDLAARPCWIRGITAAGIPVMGHVGVTKQKIVSAGPHQPARTKRCFGPADHCRRGRDGEQRRLCARSWNACPTGWGGSSPRASTSRPSGSARASIATARRSSPRTCWGSTRRCRPVSSRSTPTWPKVTVDALGVFRREVETGVYPGAGAHVSDRRRRADEAAVATQHVDSAQCQRVGTEARISSWIRQDRVSQ